MTEKITDNQNSNQLGFQFFGFSRLYFHPILNFGSRKKRAFWGLTLVVQVPSRTHYTRMEGYILCMYTWLPYFDPRVGQAVDFGSGGKALGALSFYSFPRTRVHGRFKRNTTARYKREGIGEPLLAK